MAENEHEGGSTFFIPAIKGLKKGDKVTLQVASVDPDNGDLEVRVAKPEGSEEDKLEPMLQASFQQPGQQAGGQYG